jgi:hypothetical protein
MHSANNDFNSSIPDSALTKGTFDWMTAIYLASPQFDDLPDLTQRSYRQALARIANYPLKDGRRFGTICVSSITPAVADQMHARLKSRSDGSKRARSAMLSMRVAQRAWSIAQRRYMADMPSNNPFAKMGIVYRPTPTRPVTYQELLCFVAEADRTGDQSIGTAAMIAFFWLQRQTDILARLSWHHYRPVDAPEVARIFHHKTHELVDIPLFDNDGSHLWPELSTRLDTSHRHGALIVTRDHPDRLRKTHLPWQPDYFRHRVAEIRAAAGIDPQVKFMGLRHGGNTEGADADLTDAQLRALSGHRTANMVLVYAKASLQQRREGARKRREAREAAVLRLQKASNGTTDDQSQLSNYNDRGFGMVGALGLEPRTR